MKDEILSLSVICDSFHFFIYSEVHLVDLLLHPKFTVTIRIVSLEQHFCLCWIKKHSQTCILLP